MNHKKLRPFIVKVSVLGYFRYLCMHIRKLYTIVHIYSRYTH